MAELSKEFTDDLAKSLAENQGIKVITYELNDGTEAQIDQIIRSIFGKYGREDLHSTAYTCIKELIINASKANFKYLYFEKNGYNITDPQEYREKSIEFKQHLEEEGVHEIARTAREVGRDVTIRFQYDKSGCRVTISNNTPITPEDDKRIRNRLQVGSQYDDIAQFYMEQSDSLEGAGIGIALVQILLKGENIDHKSFTLWTNDDGTTIAKLEFPFTESGSPRAKP